MVKLFAFVSFLFLSLSIFAAIPYCARSKPITAEEHFLIQNLVQNFATEMNCQIGNNCLNKFSDDGGVAKFSIAWEKKCGPIINSVHQIGSEGHGSTFTCFKDKQNKTCCAPLGYEDFATVCY